MKSIKPGRGPSAMGAMGSAVAIIFGIFWTIMAGSMGAPIFFPLFGIIFIGIGIVQFIYNYKNATGKNRMSVYDITDEGEESDPFDNFVSREDEKKSALKSEGISENKFNYCPYCGNGMGDGFKFCPSCGKEVKLR